MTSPFYVTTPIYYVNDVPHIGHAYTTVATDALARYYRLRGRRVHFLTGTDEHGQKMQRAAEERGLTPQELADRNAGSFQELWRKMNVSYDDFIRTTEPRHEQGVAALYRRMAEQGDIYLGEYEDWYCVPDETYYTELQLVDGKCPMCKRPVEKVKEESYFFRMSQYQDRLLQYMKERPEFVQPEARRNEIMNFVASGLRDLSISRISFSWGIPVPDNPRHVIYVWLDALANYITALGYPNRESDLFKTFWSSAVHLIGKDILRHHAVYWPCFLMSVGLPLPRTVFAHGWWTHEGRKMSKSLGNFIAPDAMIDRYGLDPFRYFLLREVPFGGDGDFSEAALRRRINAELANDLGNLLSRTGGMATKYSDGYIAAPGALDQLDQDLRRTAEETLFKVDHAFSRFDFYHALDLIWILINKTNKFVDSSAPWTLAKDPANKERLGTVLYCAAESLRLIALLVAPFMPQAAERMWEQLGIAEPIGKLDWSEAGRWGALKPGTRLHKGAALFPRLEDK